MSIRLLSALAVCFTLALTGCVSASPSADASRSMSTSTPTSPTPTSAHDLTITLDDILYAHDGSVDVISLGDGLAVLSLFESLYGFMPDGTRMDVYPGVDSGLTRYDWSEVVVLVRDHGSAASVAILAPAAKGVPMRTQEGVMVGSVRSDAIAANARTEWYQDENGEWADDYLALGPREVPGTQSLNRPGLVGSDYILLVMEGDYVKGIQVPSNDFSDI